MRATAALLLAALAPCVTAQAENAALATPGDTSSASAGSNSFLDNWFATSDAAKESQPHWMTPVVTVTPRLASAAATRRW